jgi:hypothetical protein
MKPVQISDRTRSNCDGVECIAEWCYGCFSWLCIVGEKMQKIRRGHCVQKVHLGDTRMFVLSYSAQKQKKLMC